MCSVCVGTLLCPCELDTIAMRGYINGTLLLSA